MGTIKYHNFFFPNKQNNTSHFHECKQSEKNNILGTSM